MLFIFIVNMASLGYTPIFTTVYLVCWAKTRRLVLNEVKPNVYRETYLSICFTERPNPHLFRSG